MDQYTPLAPSHVRVLVLPIGQVERGKFLAISEALQNSCSVVPLEDLIQHNDEDTSFLSPHRQFQGSLLYSFTAPLVAEQAQQLSPFELWRDTLLVLGVVSLPLGDVASKEALIKKSLEQLRERYGRVVHRHLLVLRRVDDIQHNFSQQNITFLVDDDSEVDLASKLISAVQNISVRFLHELSTYAQAMQASPSIQTPGQPPQGLLRSMHVKDNDRPRSHASTPVEPRSPSGEENGSRPTSREFLPPPATTFDQMAANNSLGRSDSHGSRRSRSRPRKDSLDRVPVQGLSKEKLKDRGKARVGVVIGSIYLLAGQWNEALKILVDNTTRLRALSDHIWHAKGLEYIFVCLLLHVWARLEFQVPPILYQLSDKVRDRFSKAIVAELQQRVSSQQSPIEKLSVSIPDLLKHILLLYHAVESTIELPYLTVAQATIRFSKTLTLLHQSHGVLRQQDVNGMVCGRGRSVVEQSATKQVLPTSQSLKITKSTIAEFLPHALPAHEENIKISEYISILTGVASVYASLGMQRKKVITLKSLVTRLVNTMDQARRLGAAETGIHPAASLSIENGPEALLSTIQGSQGLPALAQEIVGVFGIQLGSSSDRGGKDAHFGSNVLKSEILKDLIRLCEAAPDLQGISSLVSACMVTITPIHAVDISSVQNSVPFSAEDQARYLGMMNKAHSLSKQLNLSEVSADYWDPRLVRSVIFRPSSQHLALVRSSSIRRSGDAIKSRSASNPLLYDPNASKVESMQHSQVLVRGEQAICEVTVQNILDVSIDIEYLELITDGIQLIGKTTDVRVGPMRLQQLAFEVMPEVTGTTSITGCRIKVSGCRERAFHITSSAGPLSRPINVKSLGQDALSTPETNTLAAPENSSLAVEIIEQQPKFVLKHDASTPSSLMLLIGERRNLALSLYNDSSIPGRVQSIDCSIGMLHKPNKPQQSEIQPWQQVEFDFDITAHERLDHVDIVFTYGTSSECGYERHVAVHLDVTTKPAVQVTGVYAHPDRDDRVCLTLDVLNRWHTPLMLAHDTLLPGADVVTKRQAHALAAGETQRLSATVKRWVKDVSVRTDAQTIVFDLQERLEMQWHMPPRSGNVRLDADVFGTKVIDLIRGPHYMLTTQLIKNDSHPTDLPANTVTSGAFFTLRTTVENRSGAESGPMRLELFCSTRGCCSTDSRQGIAVAGSRQALMSSLPAGGRGNLDCALCLLGDGVLAIDAMLKSAIPALKDSSGHRMENTLDVRVVP